jgi:hypothetical protein
MGLQLPSELTTFLQMVGYNWPQADETKLFEMGQKWTGFSSTLGEVMSAADTGASGVWNENAGDDIRAFSDHWSGEDGPSKVLGDSSTASTLVGTGMYIVGAIVLALKVQVIIQLVTLAIQIAQAIATAVVTFGASLAEIPIFQQISRQIVGMLVDQVITQLLNA